MSKPKPLIAETPKELQEILGITDIELTEITFRAFEKPVDYHHLTATEIIMPQFGSLETFNRYHEDFFKETYLTLGGIICHHTPSIVEYLTYMSPKLERFALNHTNNLHFIPMPYIVLLNLLTGNSYTQDKFHSIERKKELAGKGADNQVESLREKSDEHSLYNLVCQYKTIQNKINTIEGETHHIEASLKTMDKLNVAFNNLIIKELPKYFETHNIDNPKLLKFFLDMVPSLNLMLLGNLKYTPVYLNISRDFTDMIDSLPMEAIEREELINAFHEAKKGLDSGLLDKLI